MFGIFKSKGKLNGTISITRLPQFKGHLISLSLFPVEGAESAYPFADVIPVEARNNEDRISQADHFDRTDSSGVIQVPFHLTKPEGWYYIQLNVILYREQEGKMFAQVERFPFKRRPLQIPQPAGQDITLPVAWPEIRIEDMEQYGTVTPNG